ncbi:hypothetical protein HCG49_06415 [Arenibacter sp. 6A1]|uniref:hypothetical protein n=1 Tax=Arenibacter sp. 6A1 TaxID=2720391 RepID=UPI0014485826|nr:hypothetical protein [Arenibacter sp. 6A1]NKI26189.1 hypothetical protein [Arenibacter sp. 6A1]
MIKKSFLLFAMLLIAISFSCKEEESKTQMQNVIAVHDEVMPKMGTISQLISQLEERSMEDHTYMLAKKDLELAHKAMMDWMKGFSERFSPNEIMKGQELSEEKQQWLDEEEVKVNALKEQMNSSIEKAQQLLQKE